MRKQWAFGAIVALVAAQPALAGDIDEGLKPVMNATPADGIISTLVFLNEQVDIDLLNAQLDLENAKLQRRHEVVVRALQQVAANTQNAFLKKMRALETAGRIERLHAYWISNVFRIDARVEEIEKIASHPSVRTVYFNYPIELIEPVESSPGGIGAAVTNSLREIRAPEAWALGYTGAGVLVANIDTGVDGAHPALAGRWAGVADPRYAGHPEWAWFDPFQGRNDFPRDFNGHGTHTMGTVCGGAPGREIGVAPGAIWMGSSPIDRGGGVNRTVADALRAFEWMADPDGNPATNFDVPAVCSNSWGVHAGHGFPPCDDLFWSHLDALEAVGCVMLFSAGNEGTRGLRRPADRATDEYRTCAVAAVDCEAFGFPWPIAGFSSRGPTFCTPDGSAAIKPDISAPGVNVDSASPGGGYRRLSGTSMASPHVNGVVAIIRQACPDLTVPEVKQILFDSAVDLGSAGEDNVFGWGNINAEAAVLLALERCVGFEVPDSFTIVRGQLISGDLPDLFESDDSRLVVQTATFAPQPGPPVQVEVQGTSPEPSPSELRFRLESAVDQSSVQQRILMYDFVAQSYEEVDVRTAATSDTVVEIVISDNPSRFIEPGTSAMKTLLTWEPLAFAGWVMTAEIDQTVWSVTE